MAKRKDLTSWVRMGGAIGDDDMADNEAFNAGGAGVVESVSLAANEGANPGDGVTLPQKPGAVGE